MALNPEQEGRQRNALQNEAKRLDREGDHSAARWVRHMATDGSKRDLNTAIAWVARNERKQGRLDPRGGGSTSEGTTIKGGTGCFSLVLAGGLVGGLAAAGIAIGVERAYAAETQPQTPVTPPTTEVRSEVYSQPTLVFESPKPRRGGTPSAIGARSLVTFPAVR